MNHHQHHADAVAELTRKWRDTRLGYIYRAFSFITERALCVYASLRTTTPRACMRVSLYLRARCLRAPVARILERQLYVRGHSSRLVPFSLSISLSFEDSRFNRATRFGEVYAKALLLLPLFLPETVKPAFEKVRRGNGYIYIYISLCTIVGGNATMMTPATSDIRSYLIGETAEQLVGRLTARTSSGLREPRPPLHAHTTLSRRQQAVTQARCQPTPDSRGLGEYSIGRFSKLRGNRSFSFHFLF